MISLPGPETALKFTPERYICSGDLPSFWCWKERPRQEQTLWGDGLTQGDRKRLQMPNATRPRDAHPFPYKMADTHLSATPTGP